MVEMKNVALRFDSTTVLDGMDLTVPAGAHAAFMGPSGCGKTSLLRLAAGLQMPDSGKITVNTQRISFVFQEPRLLPWHTAAENINAVLGGKKSTMAQALSWLSLVGLSDAADKYPAELSGGMRQRVNLARALAYDGELILLDEPLSGLDDDRRAELLALIRANAVGKTVLLATHSGDEAAALADSIYVYADRRFVPKK